MKVQPDDVENLVVAIFCRQFSLRILMKDRFELFGIDTSPMVPKSVIFGVDFEYLACPLQKLWCKIAFSDLGQN